jgi:putative endonuclease
MATTYILYSDILDKYYIGHTDALIQERLKKHLSDHDGFTAKAKDWKVVFTRAFELKKEAHAFERKIKQWKSRKMIEMLITQA